MSSFPTLQTSGVLKFAIHQAVIQASTPVAISTRNSWGPLPIFLIMESVVLNRNDLVSLSVASIPLAISRAFLYVKVDSDSRHR